TRGEADQLRRAMGAWRRPGVIEQFRKKLIDGMLARGLSPQFAEQVFHQIRGFGEYGFPESHAASFALLVYVSAWLKCYYPAAFAAALLNAQPMGFYQPAQLVGDAQQHGVAVRPLDVNFSDWDCTLEADDEANPSLPTPLPRGARGEEAPHPQPLSPAERGEKPTAPLAPLGRGVGGEGSAAEPVLALRLGLRLVRGLSQGHAAAIVQGRGGRA